MEDVTTCLIKLKIVKFTSKNIFLSEAAMFHHCMNGLLKFYSCESHAVSVLR